jgi:RNA polymerase sigma factor (sigma-70 family)
MVSAQLGTALRHLCGLAAARGTEALSDNELLRRFCAGREEAAFAALMQRHGRLVWGVCRDVLRCEQDAEDAFQATFLVLARQAGTIRQGEAVAGWLHGTARRIALAARRAAATRRIHERRGRSMPSEKPLSEEALREALGMLDDEVQGLPERQRAVFVLCCLEGKGRAEAARQLGWKEGTVASTLARARQRLRRRLALRGVTLSSALCAVVLARQARAAAPAVLARSTVRAALSYAAGNGAAGTVSTAAAALARGATRTMTTTKLKTATVFLLALTFGAAGVGTLAYQEVAARATEAPPTEARRPPDQGPTDRGRAQPAAPEGKEAEAREVSGRVLGPDGKPFAGAKLFVVTRQTKRENLAAKATTGDDGRFRVLVPPADLAREARLLATANGHGPDWAELGNADRPGELTLRLVKDDVPIEGRVLDLEGRPLAGVAVQLLSVEKRADGGDLKPWIETRRKRARRQVAEGPPMTEIGPAALGLPAEVKTGADGTFRLTGLGRERVARLAIREQEFEYADLSALTTPLDADSELQSQGVCGPTFTHLAVPSRPVVGTVRDKRTGKLLAGILVTGHATVQVGKAVRTVGPVARATTDEKGRYRLAGLGKHEHYHLEAGAIPYFRQDKFDVKDAPGLEPLTVDFDLEQGVVVRGHLTDKATGKPVRGWVHCTALASNPNLKDFTGQRQPDGAIEVAADGSFAVVAVPGPGLLLVHAHEADRYARTEVGDDDPLRRDLAALDRRTTPSRFHAVVRINPSEKDAKSTACDIALEPGQTRTGTVVGPDGKPLPGAFAGGLSPIDISRVPPLKLDAATFTAVGLSARTPRPLFFFHPEKRLSKLEWVKADGADPLTVRLEPPGTITGRVVDAAGRPLAGLSIDLHFEDVVVNKNIPFEFLEPSSPLDSPRKKTDAEGKFRFEGLAPALKYRLYASGGALGERFVDLAREQSVESGKVKDLGDLKGKEPAKGQEEKEQ